MAKGDKYIDLKNYLKGLNKEKIELSFEEIEKIVSFKLPASAYNPTYSWWGNDKEHSQAIAWMSAGYKVSVDFERQKSVFKMEK